MKDSSSNPSSDAVSPTQAQLLHSLANKLLPIVVFSELALRQCQDERVKQQLEKIYGAAGDARDIIQELKKQKIESTV
ncbi:MAG: hypothetical protein AB7P17_07955 [Nitrospirales bacterium]|nr:hypothetical protein [Nitrospirales bacterium]